MFLFVFLALRLFLGGRIAHYSWAFETENNKIVKHFFVAFLRDGQVTFQRLSDRQIGDKRVTLNHLAIVIPRVFEP